MGTIAIFAVEKVPVQPMIERIRETKMTMPSSFPRSFPMKLVNTLSITPVSSITLMAPPTMKTRKIIEADWLQPLATLLKRSKIPIGSLSSSW